MSYNPDPRLNQIPQHFTLEEDFRCQAIHYLKQPNHTSFPVWDPSSWNQATHRKSALTQQAEIIGSEELLGVMLRVIHRLGGASRYTKVSTFDFKRSLNFSGLGWIYYMC